MCAFVRIIGGLVVLLGSMATVSLYAQSVAGASTVLYQTGFEFIEGFSGAVVERGGWTGTDAGGNGLISGIFPGDGQHAYIGLVAPQDPEAAFVNIWKPINFLPPSASESLVQFSVLMQIIASSNEHPDDFRWSVYNTAGTRLFTLDFDTSALEISYSLDQPTDFVSTGFGFDTQGSYDLTVWMDFGRNFWSASLNGVIIANSKTITAAGAPLNLGDIDAVWAIRQPGSPGNNSMVFDDYEITVANVLSIPPTVEPLGIGANHAFIVRIFGEENLNYNVEATTDWLHWESVGIFKAPSGGFFDYEDSAALQTSSRFFRARQAP